MNELLIRGMYAPHDLGMSTKGKHACRHSILLSAFPGLLALQQQIYAKHAARGPLKSLYRNCCMPLGLTCTQYRWLAVGRFILLGFWGVVLGVEAKGQYAVLEKWPRFVYAMWLFMIQGSRAGGHRDVCCIAGSGCAVQWQSA